MTLFVHDTFSRINMQEARHIVKREVMFHVGAEELRASHKHMLKGIARGISSFLGKEIVSRGGCMLRPRAANRVSTTNDVHRISREKCRVDIMTTSACNLYENTTKQCDAVTLCHRKRAL